VSEQPAGDVARSLTGLCTYLVQSHEFREGDEVDLVLKRDPTGTADVEWLPLTAVPASADRDSLDGTETEWGDELVLARASLAATGGQPRDSMNQPADDYDPDALTLTDVRIVDRATSRPR
jgi:hypothetical protein